MERRWRLKAYLKVEGYCSHVDNGFGNLDSARIDREVLLWCPTPAGR